MKTHNEGVSKTSDAGRELLGLETEFQNLHAGSVSKKSNGGAFENFLMAKYERLVGATRIRSYPYVMMIDPSNICQLRCPGCMTGVLNEFHRKQHAPASFARPAARLERGVLDSILEECGEVLFYCHFYNWSEPLLNDELPDFIRAASERNIFTKVDSNLSLRLSDEKLEALLLSGLGELAASIDGFSQATYEQYRRGGRFELARDNLARLAAMRDRLGVETRITWNFIVFSFNEHEAADVAAWCERHNVYFNPKDAVIGADMGEEWLPSYRREGKPNPWREYQDIDARSSEQDSPAGAVPLSIANPENRSCGWHYGYTSVSGDGGVAPCCLLYRTRDDFGEVTDAPGSFGRVWNNGNFESARRILAGRAAPVTEYPVAACSQCRYPKSFLDHYAVLDREIVRSYWRFPEGSEVRRFDELFTLLQSSPAAFVEAFAAHGYRPMDDIDAAQHVSPATEREPHNAATFAKLGFTLFAEDKYEEAASAFERALALDPKDTKAHERLIYTYVKLKRFEEVERQARIFLGASPGNPRVHLYLASALKQSKRVQEALEHARRAAELDPANERYRRYADDLEKLVAKNAAKRSSNSATTP